MGIFYSASDMLEARRLLLEVVYGPAPTFQLSETLSKHHKPKHNQALNMIVTRTLALTHIAKCNDALGHSLQQSRSVIRKTISRHSLLSEKPE